MHRVGEVVRSGEAIEVDEDDGDGEWLWQLR